MPKSEHRATLLLLITIGAGVAAPALSTLSHRGDKPDPPSDLVVVLSAGLVLSELSERTIDVPRIKFDSGRLRVPLQTWTLRLNDAEITELARAIWIRFETDARQEVVEAVKSVDLVTPTGGQIARVKRGWRGDVVVDLY